MYQRRGALFVDYLKRRRVEDEAYFTRLIHYIHYNPVRHGFCQSAAGWLYSSYRAVLGQQDSKIEKEVVLAWYGGLDAFEQRHRLLAPEKEMEHLLVDDLF